METPKPYHIQIKETITYDELNQNSWLVILHAYRMPPHIGLLISGNYNSLTLKGIESNIKCEVLLKTIKTKNIEALFIKLKQHPVFSLDYQLNIFQLYLTQLKKVRPSEASCLSPIKLFLSEFYAMENNKMELLFEIMERLKQNDYIDYTIGLNLKDELDFYFPTYDYIQLQEFITNELNQIKLR